MIGAEQASIADKRRAAATAGNELAIRVLSTFVLAPLAIATAYAGGWVFGIFWLVAAIGIWWEWNAMVSGADNRLLFVLGAASLILALIMVERDMVRTSLFIIILGALGTGVFAAAERRIWAAGGLIYAGTMFTAATVLRRDPELGFVASLFLFAVVWATDTLAYFAGRALGGPKLLPRTSPHKTWSGAIGGAAGAVLAGIAIAKFAALPNLWAAGLVALLLSIAAQVGDLFESAIKRRFGAKDASRMIPGHGGFMDRLDGFVAAAIAAALFGMAVGGMDAAAQGLLLW